MGVLDYPFHMLSRVGDTFSVMGVLASMVLVFVVPFILTAFYAMRCRAMALRKGYAIRPGHSIFVIITGLKDVDEDKSRDAEFMAERRKAIGWGFVTSMLWLACFLVFPVVWMIF